MRNYLLFIFLVSSILIASGKDVSQREARKAADSFIKIKRSSGIFQVEDERIGSCIVFGKSTQPDFYVFKLMPQGFIIISGVEERYPVIGYSFENDFVEDSQPENYKRFLKNYSEEIAYIRENKVSATEDIKRDWAVLLSGNTGKGSFNVKGHLDPLVPSKWNQDFPYNIMCPENSGGPGGHVYSGCVATAMAQVMYYWRYPLQGTGSHSYYYGQYGTITANFGETEYDWYGMGNSISTKDPYPIAELQFHCGVAVEMMYGPNGSGAFSQDVPPALENYFGYSTDAYFDHKDNYSTAEWINMLKDNLDNGYPLYYSGYGTPGGHAFVCDGYDDDNFHFNFGWSGTSDGYYSLSNVNGFHDGQGAVFDTYPDAGYPYFCTGDTYLTNRSGTIEDGSGPVANYQDDADCRWIISPQTAEDSISSIKISFSRFDVMPGDSLIIYKGVTTDGEIITTLSGAEIPEEITIEGNEALIRFVSDESGNGNGWLASFQSTSPDYCTGLVTFTDDSSTFTDGSGSFNYQNLTSCMWEIIPDNADDVTLSFSQFDTEPDFDFVRIYDLESQELLAEYSGHYDSNNLPAPVTSYSGKMVIMFYTNGSDNFDGWTAEYNINTVGIESFDKGNFISIFPNPVTEFLNIRFRTSEEQSVGLKILNLSGQTVYADRKNISGRVNIDMSDLVPGLYVLTVETENDVIRKKITKL